MRWVLRTLALLYFLGLLAALAAMRFVGERDIVTASMVFLPIQIWIYPAYGILLLCLIWDRRLAVIMVALIAWYILGYLRPEYNEWLPRMDGDVTIVSCNLGTSRVEHLKPFLEREQPDVIAFQEVNGLQPPIVAAFPEMHAMSFDQFLLLSRLPILNVKVIEMTTLTRRVPCVARFELESEGKRFVLYNVHMPTPRFLLDQVRRKPSILVPGVNRRRREYLEAEWRNRVTQIDELIAVVEKETLPMLLVGDFNMPSQGVEYPKFGSRFLDAFRERGRRFGNTFPCDQNPPLRYFAPWSRLDYQFADANWEVCYFNLEKGRRAQHRATAARFRLK